MEKHKDFDSNGDDVKKLKRKIDKLERENETFKKMLFSYEKSFERVRNEIISGERTIEALENLQELSREELLSAIEEAHSKGQLVEIKNAFVSNISHELRTPLTLAMAPLELLLEGELGQLSPQQFAHVEIVYGNAKRLLKLVDELLDLAKIDAGKMEPVYVKEDFAAFCRALFDHFSPYADQNGVTYTGDFGKNSVSIFFDSDKIEKVVNNLVVNAIKYASGTKEVRVYIEETEKEVFFKVNNTGPALDAKLLNKVFDRFQRLENAKKERVIGSGLGLALSKELVKLHKGTIGISSNDKEGTTVWFSLQKGTSHLSEEQKKLGWGRLERRRGQRPERIKDGASHLVKEINGFYDFDSKMLENLVYDTVYDNKVKVFNIEKNILIADDNKEMLGFLNFVLGRYFNIITASNGEEALSLAREMKPDLILSDIMMPVMDGYELCRSIKSDKDLKAIPVILLTAKTKNVYEKIKGLEIGADDYLSKPFNVKELVARINALLRMKGLYAALENFENVIFSLANAVEAKDEYTNGHCQRLMDLAIELAKLKGFNKQRQLIIRHGSMLHDVGKIGIPENILNKPGILTDEEFAIIKSHPIIGEKICAPLKGIENFIPIIRNHHERMDGKGYPDGLMGEEIPVEVRIVSVADAFDALYSDRPYRKGMNMEEVLDFFNKNLGRGQWDDDILKLLSKVDFFKLEKKWKAM